jgi:hypothetical protein
MEPRAPTKPIPTQLEADALRLRMLRSVPGHSQADQTPEAQAAIDEPIPTQPEADAFKTLSSIDNPYSSQIEYLPLAGGTVSGSVSIGANQPNYVTIAGGAAGSPATITTAGPWADLDISPALQGRLHMALWRNYPAPSNLPELARWDYVMEGAIPSGQQPAVEYHGLNYDTADASQAQGGGMGCFVFSGGPGAGAVGGRTLFGATLTQSGDTICAPGQFYVAGARFSEASYSAGGTSGNNRGSLFGGNDSARLHSGAALWEAVIGHEINIAVETGASCHYKHGLSVIFWSTDAVAGSAGKDYGIGISASGTCAGWDVGYAFGDAYGTWPMKPAGTLIGTISGVTGPAYQAAWGVDFSQVAFSSGLIRGPGFSVDGAGHASATGLSFGSTFAASSTDFSKHINLYGGTFGINVDSNANLCIGAQAGFSTIFMVGTGPVATIGINGITSQAAMQIGGASGPTWTTGSGVPSSTQPVGSLYSRVSTWAAGATLYVSKGAGAWTAVASV